MCRSHEAQSHCLSIPLLRHSLVSCSLSLTLELWHGFRLSWQEGVLDKTDLFHLIWKMSPLPYDHFSDSLSCQWGSGHYTPPLSRGTNGLFFVVVAQLCLGGYCHHHLLHWNVKKLSPRTRSNPSPHAFFSGKEQHCANEQIRKGRRLSFKGHKLFRMCSIYAHSPKCTFSR